MEAAGVVNDPLFVALTRPAMSWGVPYAALLMNAMVTAELFLLTHSIPWILVCLPIHGVFWLLCLGEPRIFDLLLLWGRTRARGMFANTQLWQAHSYAPLVSHGGAIRSSAVVVIL